MNRTSASTAPLPRSTAYVPRLLNVTHTVPAPMRVPQLWSCQRVPHRAARSVVIVADDTLLLHPTTVDPSVVPKAEGEPHRASLLTSADYPDIGGASTYAPAVVGVEEARDVVRCRAL